MTKVMTFMIGDLFHIGHLNLLKRAKGLGDILIVGVASDYAVDVESKKPLKTFIKSEDRLRIIQAIKEVDFAFLYSENCDLERAIEIIYPDVICRGDDWKDFPGRSKAKELKIPIKYLSYTTRVSSTIIKEKICSK